MSYDGAAVPVAALLALLATSGCARSETSAERCGAARDRYLHLIDERLQEASEVVSVSNEHDGLTRLLTRYSSRIVPRARSGFVPVCEAADVEALVRCVDLEVKRFEKLQADKRDLGLDLNRPWIIRSGDPSCRPIFQELERRLFAANAGATDPAAEPAAR